MNKKRYYVGLVLIIAGGIVTYLAGDMLRPQEIFQPPLAWILLGAGGVLLILGLVLSVGELVKSVVKRLKESRERDRLRRDRQRQARRNKGGPASQ